MFDAGGAAINLQAGNIPVDDNNQAPLDDNAKAPID